ncbi:Aste57867_4794 [Aphanomyces stellatus]|nr:hypothetical protein As57867_004781 [Aphanomyces stellatus]VFT81889.1 Aste57867_4794 [Aphanomyces stellatus]
MPTQLTHIRSQYSAAMATTIKMLTQILHPSKPTRLNAATHTRLSKTLHMLKRITLGLSHEPVHMDLTEVERYLKCRMMPLLAQLRAHQAPNQSSAIGSGSNVPYIAA